MSIINIREVEGGQSKVLIAIAGISGSGKTYTALKIARGMVDNPNQIGFLDTEHGRGSLYANILDGKFLIGDLYAPFSPDRYAKAIKEFQDAGVKVLIVDSVSHEWEGEGSCEDIANSLKADGTERKVADWKKAKFEHKKFMNAILHSNMDMICCIRAREKTDFKDPNKPVSLGVQPICEKNFMFEMTASFMCLEEGKKQKFLKVPEFLKPCFGNGNGYLGEETGRMIKEIMTRDDSDTDEIKRVKSEALLKCSEGVASLQELWTGLDKKIKAKLKGHFTMCIESAKAFENSKKEEPQDLLDVLISLFNSCKETLPQDEIDFIQKTINDKTQVNYDKLIYKLKALIDAQ